MKNVPKKTTIKSELGDNSDLPTDEQQDIEDAIEELYTQSMKIFTSRRQQLKENVTKIYSIIWGNCTHLLQYDITSLPKYEEKSKVFDALYS